MQNDPDTIRFEYRLSSAGSLLALTLLVALTVILAQCAIGASCSSRIFRIEVDDTAARLVQGGFAVVLAGASLAGMLAIGYGFIARRFVHLEVDRLRVDSLFPRQARYDAIAKLVHKTKTSPLARRWSRLPEAVVIYRNSGSSFVILRAGFRSASEFTRFVDILTQRAKAPLHVS